MKKVIVLNQKGGVGKSITAYNFAYFLAERHSRVLFIDADPQCNSTTSLRQFQSELTAAQFFGDKPITFPINGQAITLARADDNMKDVEQLPDEVIVRRLSDRFAEAAKYFDYCVIDTPGANAKCVGGLLFYATHALIPTEIDTYSVSVAVRVLQRVVGIQQRFNKGLVNLGMLPSRLKPGAVNQRRELEGLLRDYGRYVLPVAIFDRMPFREAADEGVPVWQYTKRQKRDDFGKPVFDAKNRPAMERVSNEAAAKEMLAAFEHIYKKVSG